ncbi:MAG: UDP-N-acetylmuramoyl-tripeptide--D-alanyl-D-alanine ligase [Proteobacteria bacterium]|jgi:UDP-N-acetylmuramoyl-tripeptide--D-alanyl-D-alanine ligase|nr:UDP-N-acetylmuramoyl-tripeptide--D-alanyl-D-alanine ligase [Pseudomonadota bacterium]MBU4229284.1 UDP-N-acetylmuramoyl-tripeptide--D-alanyl-D-alanine ligase [Pseudomonadota bacterium]MBU4407941.1 UDP-N-acetylmuramoyl-tripeptide--D-alanyl-D-alanine ligase [Pseudomonadota bacterium]MBU4411662.1 UDP-N-acetylmuramoyl-tripeptide--D-alanyl-D-alanine ligase [Pseudomonadota bacterium]PKN17643.1 MAG: UDP-N-acetylmuramoyl-tripeptide--D-alanyl-D-alanine ligase [Deltaproteobacteria bacterium HGW-Deltapr
MDLAMVRKTGACGMKNGKTGKISDAGAMQNPVWTLSQVLLATGGRFLSGRTEAGFRRVCTDSRGIEPGDLFVALRGENFDGHAYLAQAVQKGAAGLVVDAVPEKMVPVPVVLVTDTLRALGDLAAYRRSLMPDLQVVAMTGSCGKTTVKEMIAAILSREYNVLKTQGNFNNLIGLPLSLLPVEFHHDFAVMEMGMNQPGEIARLTEIADPDIACITNVQDAHLAGLSDISGVARAKGELFNGIKAWGKLVVNIDDKRVRGIARRCSQKKITFGRNPKADVRGLRLRSLGERGMAFTLQIGASEARVKIRGLGAHNVQNGLAAAAMAHAAGVKFADIVAGLESFTPFEKRLQVQKLAGGIRLVNDAYNANPSSMLAALETLRQMDRTHKKVVILGDMLELGTQSISAHQDIGRAVARLGFDGLLAVGEFAETLVGAARKAGMSKKKAMFFGTKEQVGDWLRESIDAGVLRQGDWVLVKGSRGMRMETITHDLLEKQG